MSIRARFLGFERETVMDEYALEKPLFSIRLPIPKRPNICTWVCCESDPIEIEIAYAEYELERVLSIDDGGPLAIYGRVK